MLTPRSLSRPERPTSADRQSVGPPARHAPSSGGPWPARVLAVLLAALTLATTGCEVLPGTVSPSASGDPAAARTQLGQLTVAAPRSMSGYSRDRFPHWSSRGDGCDTRDVVLKRDGSDVVLGDNCKIISGRWDSVYDGKSFSDPRDVDIDHMVPLANAWRSGADSWDDTRRGEFANDLTRPQLIAVSASSNRAKGDQDPSQWRPAKRDFWCQYAQRWIAVKHYWKLSVTDKEKAALEEMLGTCQSSAQ